MCVCMYDVCIYTSIMDVTSRAMPEIVTKIYYYS